MRFKNKGFVGYFILMFIALFIRGYFIISVDEVLNADESLIMIMSKHIAELKDFPIFHYGNSYLGTLDNYISMIFTKIFGLNVLSLRITSVFLSLILILVTIKLVKSILGETEGLIAGLYLSLPPIFMLTWNVRFFIGYLDILILGNILYMELLNLLFNYDNLNSKKKMLKISLLGFISGIGLWCHFLFVVYIITSFVFLIVLSVFKREVFGKIIILKNMVSYLFMFFIGFSPVLIFNLKHLNNNSLGFIASQARMYAEPLNNLIIGLYNFIFSNGLTLFGFIPPWETFRPQFTVVLHKPIIVIFKSILVLIFSVIFYILLKKIVKRNRLIKVSLLMLISLSLLTVVLMIYGYDWSKLIYPQKLFLEKLSINFMLSEMANPKVLLYLIFILPIFYLFIKEKRRIKIIFNNFENSVKKTGIILLLLHVLILILLYFLSKRSINRSPRFIFPLYTFLPFFIALIFTKLKKYSKLAAVFFIFVLVLINGMVDLSVKPINLYKPIPYVNTRRIPDSYKQIIGFLKKKKIFNVYSYYWVGFPIVFNSGERIYSIDKGSRIHKYKERVERSKRVAFIFLSSFNYWNDFEFLLKKNKIDYKRQKIEGFMCYYDIDIGKLKRLPIWKDIMFILSLP
jgi:hypothetical protein